jgi:hypothetical protein
MPHILFALLAAGLLWPGSALALQCDSHVEQTERNLVQVKKLLKDVKEKNRPRIQGFIDDAAKILAKAKKECESAESPLDRSIAAARALVAQGNLGAAHLLIKAD